MSPSSLAKASLCLPTFSFSNRLATAHPPGTLTISSKMSRFGGMGSQRGFAVAAGGVAALGAAVYYAFGPSNAPGVPTSSGRRTTTDDTITGRQSDKQAKRGQRSGENTGPSNYGGSGDGGKETNVPRTETTLASNSPKEDIQSKKGHWTSPRGQGGPQENDRSS